MRWISGLSRRVKIAFGLFAVLVAISAANGDPKPTTKLDTSKSGVLSGVEDGLPRASTTVRRTTATERVSRTTVERTTTTTEYVPPTTRYVPPTTAYMAPTTRYVAPTSPPQPSGDCHPSYDPCIADEGSDVDCAGGGGNGPRYVNGPVYVHGYDEYDLDRDGDGVGCES